MDLGWGLLDLLGANIQLVIQGISAINKGLSLFVEHTDSRRLCVALLLPLGEGAIALIDDPLLSLSEILLLSD